MNQTNKSSNTGLAWLVTIAGTGLLISGVIILVDYLFLPFRTLSDNILVQQMGEMAGMFLGIICGGLAVLHGVGSITKTKSANLKMPPFYLFWILFGLVLGVGNLLLINDIGTDLIFPIFFLMGAALPTLAVLSWANRKLGYPINWRQGMLSLVSGSTLSIILTLILGSILPYLAYTFLAPLGEIASLFSYLFNFSDGGGLERLFFTPEIIILLIFVSLQAPIPEE
ncbi:MAG: hypothetical protein N2D54_06335, partial [Chloroflexota bacterium]